MFGRSKNGRRIVNPDNRITRGMQNEQIMRQFFYVICRQTVFQILNKISTNFKWPAADFHLCPALAEDRVDILFNQMQNKTGFSRRTDGGNAGHRRKIRGHRQYRRPAKRMTDQQLRGQIVKTKRLAGHKGSGRAQIRQIGVKAGRCKITL